MYHQGVLDLVRDYGGHFAKLRERRAFAELFLELHAGGQVVQDANELSVPLDGELADGQVQRERGAISPAPRDLPPGSDNLGSPRRQIASEVRFVLLVIRRGHQHVDVLAQEILFG